MRFRLLLPALAALGLLLPVPLRVAAQPAGPEFPPPDQGGPPPPPPALDDTPLSPLDELLAPIALYPDPLVSLILPAATFAPQVQEAADYLQGGGDPSQVGAMGWDASVAGLAHYPEVLSWMAANFAWTQQLGGAFASEPGPVMDSIQDLRRRAQAAGSLVSTPEQQVIFADNTIEIVPAQPAVIYVPQYDPAVVYVEQPVGYYRPPLFGWSQPYAAGVWLSYDFDWSRHQVWQGDWYDYQREHGGWSHPIDYGRLPDHGANRASSGHGELEVGYSTWHAPHNAPPPPPQLNAHMAGARFAQPHVTAGAPRPPAGAARINALVVARGERPPPTAGAPRNQPGNTPRPAPSGRPAAPAAAAVRPETARPQARPEARPEVRPEARPEIRSEARPAPAHVLSTPSRPAEAARPAPKPAPPKKKAAPPSREDQERQRQQQESEHRGPATQPQ